MHGSLLLSSLLLLSSTADAARSPRDRAAQRNLYPILPPGLGDDLGDSRLPKELGEKEFVRGCHIHDSHIQQLTCLDLETYLPPWIA